MRLLANENFPRQAVEALRLAGEDVIWVRTEWPGITDPEVLAHGMADNRILITFDTDFGELAFRYGLPATCGIVLFRIALRDVNDASIRIVTTLQSRTDWAGHFSVIDDNRIRMRPLN